MPTSPPHSLPPGPPSPTGVPLRESPPGTPFAWRLHGQPGVPPLVYLPGLHGDWTLVGEVRDALLPSIPWMEFLYPRDPTLSLDDYARGVAHGLRAAGVTEAWILAESFGSQVAWPLLARHAPGPIRGLLLAGGFGRYPSRTLLALGRSIAAAIPYRASLAPLRAYTAWLALRRRRNPDRVRDVREFLARRTSEDWTVMQARMRLIAGNQPEPLAAAFPGPVHYLTGLWDIIVPWPTVPRWLRRHAAGPVTWRLLPTADHAHLVSAPRTSARAILEFLRRHGHPALRTPNPLRES